MTRLRLSDGIDLEVDVPLEQVEEALEAALADGKLLRIQVSGESVTVNPVQVLYLQDAGQTKAAAGRNGATRPVAETA